MSFWDVKRCHPAADVQGRAGVVNDRRRRAHATVYDDAPGSLPDRTQRPLDINLPSDDF